MLDYITKDISFRKLVLSCGAFMLHQIKAPQFYTDIGLQRPC